MKIRKSKTKAKPFLKWVGGKTQLLNKFEKLYPKELINGEIDTYIEPFVGGGAVLFNLLQKYKINKVIIIDLNKELINCYFCIKYHVQELIEQLQKLEAEFLILSNSERKNYYLQIRDRYNNSLSNKNWNFKKAADFIFLNKTCFNGLYRVNSKGQFNVPFGKYKNPLICDHKNLILISNLLKNVEIKHGDYSTCINYIKNKTFIYFDPPYRQLKQNTSFVNYQKLGFNDDNQKELALFIKKLHNQKVFLMLSNSDPKNTNINDNFFDDLYKEFDIQRIHAKRMINCIGTKRGDVKEIIVRNYNNKQNNFMTKTNAYNYTKNKTINSNKNNL